MHGDGGRRRFLKMNKKVAICDWWNDSSLESPSYANLKWSDTIEIYFQGLMKNSPTGLIVM